MTSRLILGDCLEVMATMEADSIDAIVSDPPYGLSFMGKEWDHGVPGEAFWREALRIAKPGAFLLAFGGTRTFHRLAVAIEDAGWEIRDTIMWVYGSGFPKSHNVSKAIDKFAGAAREVVGQNQWAGRQPNKRDNGNALYGTFNGDNHSATTITAPATDAAKQWDGWGTALKPAYEPVIMARKPLTGTVAQNVLQWGTGGINIDACKVGNHNTTIISGKSSFGMMNDDKWESRRVLSGSPNGRFPANFIHDGSEEVLELFPETKSGAIKPYISKHDPSKTVASFSHGLKVKSRNYTVEKSEGSAARFFYCPKASKSERGEGNTHPTVKPIALMRYLCRLVTPPNGSVLDPFMGSGSTGVAAILEGFNFVGIDKEQAYVDLAQKRIDGAIGDVAKMSETAVQLPMLGEP